MICPVWNKLHGEFVKAAAAIRRSRPEKNKELNAAARASLDRLHQHEQEHGCKPSIEELKAEGRRREQEARRRLEARRNQNGK